MTKEQVLQDISKLIQDIEMCTGEVVGALLSRDKDRISNTYSKMSGIMVAAHQELSFLYGHIKTLYELKKKADEVYFRAGNLSADMNSSEALRKAREDYWHYVNYELLKEGDKNGI